MNIKAVRARSINDSRGEKTIEVSVNGAVASSPSGKSTGIYESKPYYKSLDFCLNFLNKWDDQTEINTFNDLVQVEKAICKKLKLKKPELFGGNALYAFESAILKAIAVEKKLPLWKMINPHARKMPIPVGNAVGGGLHSEQFADHPIFQEFLIIPREKSAKANVETMQETYETIGRMLKAKEVNDEGAWVTREDDESILKIIADFSSSVHMGVDVAASSFYAKKLYAYKRKSRTEPAQVGHITQLAKTYGIFYLEDPVEQEDFDGFKQINRALTNTLLVGDDLTATHLERIKKAHAMGAINAVLIKPNQHGSLVHVKDIADYCRTHDVVMIFSHRSGETLDSGIVDYAVAFGADYLKAGIATKWREAKLTRLVEIERNL